MKKLFILILLFFIPAYVCSSGQTPAVFATWEGFEPDKCASIWLIKRFIDKNAEIKFFPKGVSKSAMGKNIILFDTPGAIFRRYHNMSTYESMLKHYKLKDPGLISIGRIIHDIEINYWGRKAVKQSVEVNDALKQIILKSKNKKDIIEDSIKYFDLLYQEVRLGD